MKFDAPKTILMSNANQNPPLTSAMKALLKELEEIVSNPVVEAAYNEAIAHVQPILSDGSANPWVGQDMDYFVQYFRDWFTFLPTPVGGLGKIVPFTYFYLNNSQAFFFLNQFKSKTIGVTYTTEIFNWTVKFIKERGNFMDSQESLKYIEEWLEYPGTQIEDYIVPKAGFKSFNEFFTRQLKPSANPRPISNLDDDSIVVASADSEINFIETELTLTTKLNVKSRQINVNDLLNASSFAPYFEGGTAISCVLLPGNYHHYHAPVTGEIVESMDVPGIYNGIMDGDDWFNEGNIGESDTDFSIFEDFHRAYFIIKTETYGYVAIIPVGLNTISAIHPSVVNKQSTYVPPGGTPVPIQKGQELGYFAYGGSLNIVLFQKGVYEANSVLMGQRIGQMKPVKKQRVRYSVRELADLHDNNITKPLEDLFRAWKGIKELPQFDPNSFFTLGGYHGEPFIGEGAVDGDYWGGYCNHGNVLFPTWHRVYVLKVEDALRSIVPDVTLPYWDETSEESLKNGIPWPLTKEKIMLDGEEIDNPLRSFVMPITVNDAVQGQETLYTKPKGYETVRYPLSGLVGNEEAQKKTEAHNAKFPDYDKNVELLNQNILAFLKGPEPGKSANHSPGIYFKYVNCLKAPNYTVFSNTTSAGAWNKGEKGAPVTALESPHNDIHLAVGGLDIQGFGNDLDGEFGIIDGANGDMGENNTAALDPIFFFHHCNVDRMFWLWQKQNGKTDEIEIIQGYKGTSSSDSQGPTPGIPDGTPLNLDTPLNPFELDPLKHTVYTSRDCINSEKQLGVFYTKGSLEKTEEMALLKSVDHSKRKLEVRGINREAFSGSFIVHAYAEVDDQVHYLGFRSILSRWNVVKCKNCLNHLEVKEHFHLDGLSDDQIDRAKFHVRIQDRGIGVGVKVAQEPVLEVVD